MTKWSEALSKDMAFRVDCATNMLIDHLGLAALEAHIDALPVLRSANDIMRNAIQELEGLYVQAMKAGATDE